MPDGGGLGLSWDGIPPAARGTQPQGLLLPSGLSDGMPGCWRGWEMGGMDGARDICARRRWCRGLGMKLPTGARRRDDWVWRACRWRPGARSQGGCGKPDPPPRSGRELLHRLLGSRQEGAVSLAQGSRRPSSGAASAPSPARRPGRTSRQRGQCRSAAPGAGTRPGVCCPSPGDGEW